MKLKSSQPGYFEIRGRASEKHGWITYNCPCGCARPTSLPLYPTSMFGTGGHGWNWDGNLEAPTINPSIRHLDGCLFHGHLHAGRWSSAGDGAPVSPLVYKAGDPIQLTPGAADMTEESTPPEPTVIKTETATVSESATTTTIPPPPKPLPDQVKEEIVSVADHVHVAAVAAEGYIKTHALAFIEGKLHQAWEAVHPGATPATVYVPVPTKTAKSTA